MGGPRKVAFLCLAAGILALSVAAIALAGFKPAKDYPVGAETLDVVMGDFSGDGKPDLAVSNRGDDNISILRGNGTGAFGVAHDYPAGPSPLGLQAADFNGDGRLDLAVANQSAVGGVRIMLATQSGFSSRHYPAGAGSSYVVTGNFTADNVRDLAVSNLDAGTVSILAGNKNGSFAKIRNLRTGPNPFGLAVSDFNGDGKRDVAVINDPNRVSVFRGNGDGSFKPPLNSATGAGPNQMVAVRIDGDSIPDLAVADYSADAVGVLTGNGDGLFAAPKLFPTGAGTAPAEIAPFDYNHDGKTDLAVSDSGINRISVLPRRPGVSFGGPLKYPVGLNPYGIAAGNLNGDGLDDVATANYTDQTASVLLGN